MTSNQIEDWIELYVRAWRERDSLSLAQLFSSDASYKEAPWTDSHTGLDAIIAFWDTSCANQGEFEITSKVVSTGSLTAEVAVRVQYAVDKPSAWQDTWVLTFTDQGLCKSYVGWPWPSSQNLNLHNNA